ncbi:MAG TPA: hypothetical protein PLG67_04875 [Bacillota bacterium]|nr:hypothetical protein [Bacillota bacterium]
MYEEDLKRAVCLRPELIEPGLTIEKEEYPIRGEETTYRCDLKGTDSKGNTVFIELKLKANKRVLFQIAKYKAYSKIDGRYIVAALEFDSGVETVIKSTGFEAIRIDNTTLNKILNTEKDNPLLYERKTPFIYSKKEKIDSDIKANRGYSPEESEIVSNFMESIKQFIIDNRKEMLGFHFYDYSIRGNSKDKHTLIFNSKEFPGDCLVIYTRARLAKEIHFMYVPDYSKTTQMRTKKKEQFYDYIENNKSYLEDLFDQTLYASTRAPKNCEKLEISPQAWKGFSRVYIRDIDQWLNPDFIHIMGQQFIEFVEKTVPVVKDFYRKCGHLF